MDTTARAIQALTTLATAQTPTEGLLVALLRATEGQSEALERALHRVGHCLGWGSEYYALAHIGKEAAEEIVVAQALYLIIRYAHDKPALQQAMRRTNERIQEVIALYQAARSGPLIA